MGHTKKTEDIYKLSLEYHRAYPKGKLATIPTKPHNTQQDLSLAYSPGVAAPSLEIAENPENVYQYTGKGNLVGVITNGTAVLGLGNIGAEASKPVMEGKAFLFKILAGIERPCRFHPDLQPQLPAGRRPTPAERLAAAAAGLPSRRDR